MKNMKKFIIVFLCVLAACLTLGGCEKTSSQIETESMKNIWAQNIEDVRTFTEDYFVATMKNATYEDFKKALDDGMTVVSQPFDNDWAYRWGQFTEKHGAVKDAVCDISDRTDDGYTSRVILTGEDDGQMAFTITYDKAFRPISSTIADYSDDSKQTMGQKMGVAGGNTLTGLLVVFSVLILLSLIISCFKFVGKITEVGPEKKDAAPAKAPAPAGAAAPARAAVPARTEEVDLASNQELVAVIAAAIAAAEDKPVEGYVVRSIRRLKNNKWR